MRAILWAALAAVGAVALMLLVNYAYVRLAMGVAEQAIRDAEANAGLPVMAPVSPAGDWDEVKIDVADSGFGGYDYSEAPGFGGFD